jgi:hypothetical protein
MPKLMMFHIPPDKDLLAVIGEVALRHEHLNHILRMTIKTLARLEIGEALDATAYDSTSQLRERIKKLARQRLGEGAPLLKLQALLERCKRASERRNDLIHSVWGQELDGPPGRRGAGQDWQTLPSTTDLVNLAADIMQLTGELNEARLGGFLHEALEQKLAQ